MFKSRANGIVGWAAAALAAVSLAGCGKSTAAAPTEKFVYVGEMDCVGGGRIKAEDCAKAIDKALLEHDKTPLKFPTMLDCEKAEGFERCERVTERFWRPRLMAYLFTVKGDQISAVPLYAGLKGIDALRDTAGAVYDYQRTEGITFSHESARKSEGLIPIKNKR